MLLDRSSFRKEHRGRNLLWLLLVFQVLALPRMLAYQRKTIRGSWRPEDSPGIHWRWLNFGRSLHKSVKRSVRIVVISPDSENAGLALWFAWNRRKDRRNFPLLFWLLVEYASNSILQWLSFDLVLVVEKRWGLHHR